MNEEKNMEAAENQAENMRKFAEEQMKRYSKGTLTLSTPIEDGEEMYRELHWDFTKMTGAEYVDALDMDVKATNAFRLTNTQALNIFAAAAAKATKGLDAKDIRTRMGVMDAQAATQLTTVFFSACSRAGSTRISGE